MLKILDAARLNSWVESVCHAHDVIGIQERGDKYDYDRLDDPSNLRLDFDVSVNAPKRFFLLPEETLIRFKKNKPSSVIDATPFVLFGVHAGVDDCGSTNSRHWHRVEQGDRR